jgi:hypothetical protein
MKKIFTILAMSYTAAMFGQVPVSDGPQFQTQQVSATIQPPFSQGALSVAALCTPLTVTGNSLMGCDSGATIFNVTGGSCGVRWYSDPLYTNKIGWNDSLVTPMLYNDTTFYLRSNCPATGAADSILPLPLHNTVFTGNVRGYYFTAPCDFIMTGLYVPKDASTGSSNVEVVLFDGDTVPGLWPSTTNDFKSLGYFSNYSLSDTIPVCFYVDSGEVVGIYGNRADANSYAGAPYQSMINGIPTTLTRSGMQMPLSANQMQNIFAEAGGSISRTFFTYTVEMDTSVAEANVIVPQSYDINSTPSICQGDSIFLGGGYQLITGTYIDTLQSIAGCDSIITTDLTVLPALTGGITQTICAGDSIVVNGTAYNTTVTGVTEVFTGIGPNNCDSVVTVNLTVLPALTGTNNTTICANGSLVINGTTYNAANPAGTEVFTNVGPNGCDSTVTVALNVLPALTGTNNTTICANDSVVINGTTYNAANPIGTEVFTNVGPNGCDSTVTVNLTINTVDTSITNNAPTLTANATGATYQWIDCANGDTAITGATNANYTVTTNGSYAVVVTQNGCTDTSACIPVTVTGVNNDQLSVDNNKIYPNPTKGIFTVSLAQLDDNASIIVYSVVGAVIINQQLNSKQTIINLEAYDKGIYFVKITNGNNIVTQRIVKQ